MPSLSLYVPTTSVHATEKESFYFQFFTERVSHDLSGFYERSFWTQSVPQEAFYAAPVRYAAIAVAALNKGLGDAVHRDSLKVNIIQNVDTENSEYAALMYAKAIRALNQHLAVSGGAQLRTALIACILFVCFETLQGSFASAMQQTYGGLKLLRSHYAERPGSRPWIPQSSSGVTSSNTPEALFNSHVFTGLQNGFWHNGASYSNPMVSVVEDYLGTAKRLIPSVGAGKQSESNVSIVPEHDSSEYPLQQVYDMSSTTLPIRSVPDIGFHRNISAQSFTQADVPQVSEGLAALLVNPYTSQAGQNNVILGNLRPSDAESSTATPLQNPSIIPPNYYASSTGFQTPSPPPPLSQTPQDLSTSQQTNTFTSRKRPLASRPLIPALNNDLGIEDSLIRTFVRLDNQGLFFGITPGIPPVFWDIHKLYHLQIPPFFVDHETAYHCWDFLQDRALQFYRQVLFNRNYALELADPPSVIAQRYASFVAEISDFEASFQPLLDFAINPDGTVANSRALFLSVYIKITLITLAAVQSDSEMVYDDYFHSFQYITRTVNLILSANPVSNLLPNPRFTFEAGIIPPLHLVAIRCRDPTVRREAIGLLFRAPRQEGMWDSILSARIARWLCFCEEEGLGGPLPDFNSNSVPPNPLTAYSNHFASLDSMASMYPGLYLDELEIAQGGVPSVPGGNYGGLGTGSDGRGTEEFHRSSRQTSMSSGGSDGGTGIGVGNFDDQSYAWMVPEEKRMRLTVVDFHFQDRYIKVKCRRAVAAGDGTTEERETVIAW